MRLLRLPWLWFGRWFETRSILRDARTMGAINEGSNCCWTIEDDDEW